MAERENSPPTEDEAPEERSDEGSGEGSGAGSDEAPGVGSGDRPASKTTAKKAARKAPARKRPAAKAAPPKRPSGMKVAALACRQLADLTGRELEGVVGLERTDDGWVVDVEVLELRRVPNTTDVLAVYEVALDADGDLDSYRRLHRYERGKVREDS